MSIGKKIREARKAAGMTQVVLSKKANIATITLQQYEADKREPKLAQLQGISDALNVTISELVGNTYLDRTGAFKTLANHILEEYGDKTISDDLDDFINSFDGGYINFKKFITAIKGLTAMEQEKLLEYAHFLLSQRKPSHNE